MESKVIRDLSTYENEWSIKVTIVRKGLVESYSNNNGKSDLLKIILIDKEVEQAIWIYYDKQYKSRRWVFPSHRRTISVVWSPFLTKASVFEDINGVSLGIIRLYLDELDAIWTDQYENFDYVVVARGKWFLTSAIYYENSTILGCHNCQGKNTTQSRFYYAYRKALNLTLKFITSSKHKAYTFFRTTTPNHFKNGEWNTGGYCNRTRPFQEGEIYINDIDEVVQNTELESATYNCPCENTCCGRYIPTQNI